MVTAETFWLTEIELIPGRDLVFETFQPNAPSLRKLMGRPWPLVLNSEVFWGEVVAVEPCVSTHRGLEYLREKPTVRVTIHVIGDSTSRQ